MMTSSYEFKCSGFELLGRSTHPGLYPFGPDDSTEQMRLANCSGRKYIPRDAFAKGIGRKISVCDFMVREKAFATLPGARRGRIPGKKLRLGQREEEFPRERTQRRRRAPESIARAARRELQENRVQAQRRGGQGRDSTGDERCGPCPAT